MSSILDNPFIDKYKVLFLIRYGAFNYNINVHYSDQDWRGFSYEEMPEGEECFYIGGVLAGNDICIDPFRAFTSRIVSMAPKYLELLFSDKIYPTKYLPMPSQVHLKNIIDSRNDIAVMDLKRMYEAYMEEYQMELDGVRERINPDRVIKHYLHCFRKLDILERFHANGFKDFGSAIRYTDSDPNRLLIVGIKLSELSITDLLQQLESKVAHIEAIKDDYMQSGLNEDIKKEFIENVMMMERGYLHGLWNMRS